MQVVILAAGRGDRFVQAGYADPKPLIKARGRAMITYALEQAGAIHNRPIVLCPDALKFEIWRLASPDVVPTTIGIKHVQSGAAMTLLAAAAALNESEPVLTMDCDSIIDLQAMRDFAGWSKAAFGNGYASTIMSFTPNDTSSRYSFVRIAQTAAPDFTEVVEVVEKMRISNLACCGVHAFSSWERLRLAICGMVDAQDRTNDEYYITPIHKYIGLGKVVTRAIGPEQYDVIGTPEQLEDYERRAVPTT